MFVCCGFFFKKWDSYNHLDTETSVNVKPPTLGEVVNEKICNSNDLYSDILRVSGELGFRCNAYHPSSRSRAGDV